MSLLLEVLDNAPVVPEDGWDVGHLANLGVMLSAENFSTRLDLTNLNFLFDAAESGEATEIRDHSGRIIEVVPTEDSIILIPRSDPDFPNGIVLGLEALKEMGIEQYEEEQEIDPESEFDELEDDDTITDDDLDQGVFESLDEGVKRAFRRSGKKIKRGFRVTSGFRKGRVVASAKSAFKPRAKASTRSKLRLAARKKKLIRILKGKRTRRKPASKRLVRMNKRLRRK